METYIKHYADIKSGETLAYIKEGSGKNTLLLLHGNYCSSLHWSTLIERLKNDYTIYAVDFRGFGDSTYNKEIDSLYELADDIAQFCEVVGISKAAVFGWSLGGGVALSLAARYPKLVKQLVLIDSMSYRGFPMFKTNFQGKPIIGGIYTSKEDMARDPLQVRPLTTCIRNKNYTITKMAWDYLIFSGNAIPPHDDNRIYINEAFKQRCVVDALWAMANFNMSPIPTFYSVGDNSAAKVKCPIVSFWGDKDRMVPLQMASENCVGFPQTEFVIVRGSGHAPHIDNVGYLVKELNKYLL